jgi:hypothetical protein
MRRTVSPATIEITPYSVTEELERILAEATKKAGKPQEKSSSFA